MAAAAAAAEAEAYSEAEEDSEAYSEAEEDSEAETEAAEADSEPRSWPLPDDVTREIFARASYNNPSYICQVASFCKDWHRALTDVDFAQRLRHHHVAPLPIGFFHDCDDDRLPTFVPTLKSPFAPINIPGRRDWSIVDYRHGRGLFMSRRDDGEHLLVWDPISGVQHPVPVPLQASQGGNPGVAVFCAVPGCDHRPTCNGGMFRIAMLFSAATVVLEGVDDEDEEEEGQMKCLLYSSETDSWEDEASLFGFSEEFQTRTSVVSGDSLYFLSENFMIFQLDLASHSLTNIKLPEMEDWNSTDQGSIILMITEEGQLGMVEATDDNLFTWSRVVDAEGNGIWRMRYTFDHYFTDGTIGLEDHYLLGFAEGTKTFFLSSRQGMFYFELPNAMVQEPYLLNVESFRTDADPSLVFPVVFLYAPYNALQENYGQHHINHPNHDEAPTVALMEAPAETVKEEAQAERKKRLNETCDDSSPKRNKQKQPESGKEQVPGDGQPTVSGRAAVKNSAESGKRNGPTSD